MGDHSRIGVGITTHNRRDLYTQALASWQQHLPPGAVLVIVDDASATPAPQASFRFETNVGAPRAKNKCLQLLLEAGCEHLFLVDDDIVCATDDWWQPYVFSPEPHLCWGRPRRRRLETTRTQDGHLVFDWPSGALVYVTADVVEHIGGYDPDFVGLGYDHVNFSDRIFSAGLTRWRFADAENTATCFANITGAVSTASNDDYAAWAADGRSRRDELCDVAYFVDLDT